MARFGIAHSSLAFSSYSIMDSSLPQCTSRFIEHAAILAQDDTADEPKERRAKVFNSLASQLEKPFTAKDYNNLKRQGLLPMIVQPEGRGQGPGKEPLLWTPREKHILLGLCAIDDWYEERPSPAIRAQILVWLWLYAGDQFNITVNDIQNFMALWAEKERKLTPKIIQKTSIDLIDKRIGKNAQGTRDVKQKLHKIYEATHKYYYSSFKAPDADWEALHGAGEEFQNDIEGTLLLPKQAPEYVARLKREMQYVPRAITSYETCLYRLSKDSPVPFDKAIWHWARYFYHKQWSSSFQPLNGDLTDPVSFSITEWLRNSCSALARCLLVALDPQLTQSLPEHEQPEVWIREHWSTQTLPFSFSMRDDQSFFREVNLRISDQEPHTITEALKKEREKSM